MNSVAVSAGRMWRVQSGRTLRYVVDGNRHTERGAHPSVLHGGEKRCQALCV